MTADGVPVVCRFVRLEVGDDFPGAGEEYRDAISYEYNDGKHDTAPFLVVFFLFTDRRGVNGHR